jgi:hypothetical protein
MNKFYFTLLFIVLYNSEAETQLPFPLYNSTWMVYIESCELFSSGFTPIYYQTSGDTIISGKKYSIIDKSDFNKYFFLREENGLVYCKYNVQTLNDTSEFVLYNFNLNVGENIKLPMRGNPIKYDDGIVLNIDSVMINNQLHKRIIIDTWISLIIIEGVGSLQDLIYPDINWVDECRNLTCFSMNDTIFSTYGDNNFSIGNCRKKLDVNNKKAIPHIYPNPSKDYIEIEGIQMKKFMLFDFLGQKLLEGTNSRISLQNLSKGYYILRVYMMDNVLKEIKVIKM